MTAKAARGFTFIAVIMAFLWMGIVPATLAQRAVDQGAYVEPQTGIVFPAVLGGLQFAGTQKYPDERLGVGVRYNDGKAIKVDIFIYHLGQKNLGRGLASPAVKQGFSSAKQDVFTMQQQGHYQGVTPVSEGQISLTTAGGPLPALSAVFTYSQTPKPGVADLGVRTSHLLLTAYKDHFLKIRFTFPADQKQHGDQTQQRFLQDLGKQLP